MSNNSRNNKTMVPEAKAAMNRFKMEAANEVGVQLKDGYNGELTSRQAGSIGGQMVNMMCPERQWNFRRVNRRVLNHEHKITITMQAGL